MSLTGIDIPIAVLRQSFADNLWTNITNKYFYARVFGNLDENGQLIGEVLISGSEYKDVQFDDTLNMLCFFDVGDIILNVNPDNQTTQDVGIVFAVKLTEIYTNISYRATEEVYRDVLNIINDTSALSVTPNEIIRGLDAYGNLSTDGLLQYNMQPWHTFRINTEMKLSFDCSQDLSLSDTYPDVIIN